MRMLFIIVIAGLFPAACSKQDVAPGSSVEIYLLRTWEKVPGRCEVNASGAILEDSPLVKNDAIISYQPATYRYQLSDTAFQRIQKLGDGIPFALTVDKQVVYYGFYKPAVSSSSCEHSITMDLDWLSGPGIILRLGYPGTVSGNTMNDQRNNATLMATLRNQKKIR